MIKCHFRDWYGCPVLACILWHLPAGYFQQPTIRRFVVVLIGAADWIKTSLICSRSRPSWLDPWGKYSCLVVDARNGFIPTPQNVSSVASMILFFRSVEERFSTGDLSQL